MDGTLELLRHTLDGVVYPADAAKAQTLKNQLDDYIIPRITDLDAPLLVVVGGSTGAGKSTLVNAIVGENVTAAGVIRPTTRQPTLITNTADAPYFRSQRVLPGLPREHGEPDTQALSLRIVESNLIPAGLALIDAPDFDSIDDTNRALASQLLAAADSWVFVTTPARYADQVVWNFLSDAAARHIEVVVILNRVDQQAADTVPDDLRRMLEERKFDAEVFVVPFVQHELLPVESIATYLHDLALDTAARREISLRTVAGALDQLVQATEELAVSYDRRHEQATQLAVAFDDAYSRACQHIIDATSDGHLLRTEVMARWQDFVGTSDAFRVIDRWFSLARDRVGSFFTGKPTPLREVETQIETGLHAVIIDAADTAAGRCWSYLGSQAPKLRDQASHDLARAGEEISERAATLVRDWQADLVRYIEENAASKRMTARLASLGLNAVTVALMIVVFASTAGLTGGEIAIAGGSAVLGQKLLETIFGEEAVRRMAKRARQDLDERVAILMADERARYQPVTEQLIVGTPAEALRSSARQALAEVKYV
ncbi:GTPase domain-containing protein [Corynebacterium sp. ES2715-CONJ3]|uniref:dynamin family protein n=1 Tax=Corynebacterium sp. ES2715-CONJ3 TaxID=2974028 RepID=UPI0021699234|nr:GTPase domain-containing protein [Corynebacterium sp. ES2715-CONJ3]MCS4492317.1 GTPase domain-containing protein [Corynebacterium sp. ES2715-CONJ3]